MLCCKILTLLSLFRTVPDAYKEKLDKDGIWSVEEADAFSQKHYDWLNNELKGADNYEPQVIA